jgi:hypothetical protein
MWLSTTMMHSGDAAEVEYTVTKEYLNEHAGDC